MDSTSSNSKCGDYFALNTWLKYTLIASLPIILLFCFLERRVNLWPNFLNGRPAVAIPINLIDAYGDRLASAFAFVCVSVLVFNLLSVVNDEYSDAVAQSSTDTVPVMLRGVLGFLRAMGKAFLVCTACYPILLCLGTKHKVIGNAIGVFYSLLWTAYYIGRLAGCTTGVLLTLSDAWVSGPGFASFGLMTIRFVYGLVKYLYRLGLQFHQLSSLDEQNAPSRDVSVKFMESHFYQRTKYLLARPLPKEYGGNFISRVLRKHLYFDRGFKYSRQNICVLAMVLLLTYLNGTVTFNILLLAIEKIVISIAPLVGMLAAEFATTFKVTLWLAIIVTFIICFLSIVDAQKRYREHTLQLWRGDRSFCAGIEMSNEAIMVNSFRYSGFRLAFAIVGFDVLLIIIWPWFILIKCFFVSALETFWLAFVLFTVLGLAQKVMNRLLFLQRADDEEPSQNIFRERKTYLGLDNRRVFHVIFYFTLFLNIIIGALRAIYRLLFSACLGVLLIGRVDRCALQYGWESHDIAFLAYISFLQLEVAHTHPVVVTFCHLLNETIAQRKRAAAPEPTPSENIYATVNEGFPQTVSEGPSPNSNPTGRVMSARVRNRWFLALTLTRNPTLIPARTKPNNNVSLLVLDSC